MHNLNRYLVQRDITDWVEVLQTLLRAQHQRARVLMATCILNSIAIIVLSLTLWFKVA